MGILLILFTHTIIYAQFIVQGKLLNLSNEKPIAYANIGILNTPVGTISNEDGSFSITVSDTYLKDSLIFSALGFERKTFLVEALSNKTHVIHLPEKITSLPQITVYSNSNKQKTFELGNKYWKGGHVYADSVAAGSAMVLLIENKYPAFHADLTFPMYLGKARLRIHKSSFNSFKVRLRLMEVDSLTGLPGKDLVHENIIVTTEIKKGWLDFDLSPYQIQLHNPRFFLGFEWIMDDKARLELLNQYKEFKALYPERFSVDTMLVEGEKITFNSWQGYLPGTFFGVSMIPFSLQHYKTYYRTNSFGEWKRAACILTAKITVYNQPPKTKGKLEARN